METKQKEICSLGEKCQANEGKHWKSFYHETKVEKELIAVLIRYVGERGDNEGAVEVLERIVQERDILLRNAIKRDLLKLN